VITWVGEVEGALSYNGVCSCGESFVNRWGWGKCWSCQHKRVAKSVKELFK